MALLDQYGRPVRTQQLAQLQAEPGLTGVRQIWQDSVAPGLTPNRLAGILRACDEGDLDQYLTLAEEMEERDPHYVSVLGIRKRVISRIRPLVIAADEADVRATEIAEAVERDIVGHDGLADLVEDVLDALGKGFSVIEIDWQTDAGRWRPRRFLYRPQRFFAFDRETGRDLRVRTEADPTWGEPLAPYHFITHFARLKSGLPARGGLARLIAFNWICKAYTLKDWMAFIETYGLPLRLGRYGPEATKQDVETLFRAVANIGTDAAAVLPESMKIDFENGAATTADKIFENLARYADEQTSKAVLGQTMTADSGSSQSQAEVHDDVRHDIAAADARAVSGTLNRDLVRAYVDLNFGPQEVYPKLLIEVPEPEDTAALIDSTDKMLSRGLTVKSSEVRQKLGWTDPDAEDEVIGGAPAAPAPPPPAIDPPEPVAQNSAQPDEIDQLTDEALENWREVMSDLIDPIEELVSACSSYDELIARLPSLASDMRDAKLIAALVAGMVKARGLGDARDG